MLSSRPHASLLSENVSENHHNGVQTKTVKTPASSRRRAFGDISNRKDTQNQTKMTIQKRAVSFASNSTKKALSKTVAPTTLSRVVTRLVMEESSFVVQGGGGDGGCGGGMPVEEVEFRAGRPFNPFDGDDDEVNLSFDLDESPSTLFDSTKQQLPRFVMQHLDFEITHGFIDDESLMALPDEDHMYPQSHHVDLSLDEEIDFLGLIMSDVSM